MFVEDVKNVPVGKVCLKSKIHGPTVFGEGFKKRFLF